MSINWTEEYRKAAARFAMQHMGTLPSEPRVPVDERHELLSSVFRRMGDSVIWVDLPKVQGVLDILFISLIDSLVTDSVSVGDVLGDLEKVFVEKNADYGSSFVHAGLGGVLVRLSDKFQRAQVLTRRGDARVAESLHDTALDAVNYILIAYMMMNARSYLFDLTVGRCVSAVFRIPSMVFGLSDYLNFRSSRR